MQRSGFCWPALAFFLFCAVSVTAQTDYWYIDTIVIEGNEKTHDYVLLKQMVVEAGDSIPKAQTDSLLTRSKNNLRNTGLFLTVEVSYLENTQGHLHIVVQVEERWYLFPIPYFDIADRNFNQWIVEQNADPTRLVYGLDLLWYNVSGHADRLNLRAIFGFTRKFELVYERPFLHAASETGLGFYGMYASNRQIYHSTQFNKQVFVEDDEFVRNRIKAGAYLRHRQNTYMLHTLNLRYNDINITPLIDSLNPEYLANSASRLQFLSLDYTWINDRVDNRAYPLDGYYLRGRFQKRGLGFPRPAEPDQTALNQWFVSVQANLYRPLSSRWYAAAMMYGSLNLANQYPYFITESLGYCEDFVRGYEYYVIDGQGIALWRSNLRFLALDKTFRSPIFQQSDLSVIPVQVFLKAFADAGFVHDRYFTETNSLRNKAMYSVGLGVDITTYYDWVFRIESSVNALAEFGVYLHLGLDLNTYEACSIW